MLKTLRASLGFAVPIFVLVFLIQFITKLLPAQFLPNEIRVGLPFVFVDLFDLYGNINQIWYPMYLIFDFLILWTLIIGVFYLVRNIKLEKRQYF